jgi:hypothetical protein
LDGPVFLKGDRETTVRYIDGFIECPEALWGDAWHRGRGQNNDEASINVYPVLSRTRPLAHPIKQGEGRDKHILLDAYRPGRLPMSGDWVLVLENRESQN